MIFKNKYFIDKLKNEIIYVVIPLLITNYYWHLLTNKYINNNTNSNNNTNLNNNIIDNMHFVDMSDNEDVIVDEPADAPIVSTATVDSDTSDEAQEYITIKRVEKLAQDAAELLYKSQ